MRGTRKYANIPTTCKLHGSHRSKLEAAVCWLLQRRADIGEIELTGAEVHLEICGPPNHPCKKHIQYIADFQCFNLKTKSVFYVESKGFKTDTWAMKKKLYQHYGPAPLEIWEGHWQRPRLTETIVPLSLDLHS